MFYPCKAALHRAGKSRVAGQGPTAHSQALWEGRAWLRVSRDDAYCSVLHVALSLLCIEGAHGRGQRTHGVTRLTWNAACRAEPGARAGAAAGAAPGQAVARVKRMSDGSIAGLVSGRDLVQEAQQKRKVPRPPDRPEPDAGPWPGRETTLCSARCAAGPRSPMQVPPELLPPARCCVACLLWVQ